MRLFNGIGNQITHSTANFDTPNSVRRHARRIPAALHAAAASHSSSAAGKHYVIIGAGLAGLATAYHLLKQSPVTAPVHVTVYDAVGIGAGGSGAAAGLLHPFAPTGKLLWRAHEAMESALELLEAAEAAAAPQGGQQSAGKSTTFVWRNGVLKPAGNAQQSQAFWKHFALQQQQQQHFAPSQNVDAADTRRQQLVSMLTGTVLDVASTKKLVPGVQLPCATLTPTAAEKNLAAGIATASNVSKHVDDHHHHQQQPNRQPAQLYEAQEPLHGWVPQSSAAFHAPGGITLQPLPYMQALWGACQQVAAGRWDGSSIKLQIQQLQSLEELLQRQHQHLTAAGPTLPASRQPADENGLQLPSVSQSSGTAPSHASLPVTAIVVAAGAAVGSLAEVGQQLPLNLCQGYTLDMTPPPTPGRSAAAAGSSADAMSGNGSSDAAEGCHTHGMSASNKSLGSVGAAAAHTVHVRQAPDESQAQAVFPADAPSLLGIPYLASQGGQQLVVGATRQYNVSTQQAVAELRRHIDMSMLDPGTSQQHHPGAIQDVPTDAEAHSRTPTEGKNQEEVEEIAAAATELLKGAAAVWPAIQGWSISGIRSGVRALPRRSADGAMPLVGHWMDLPAAQHDRTTHPDRNELAVATREASCGSTSSVPVWLVVGLGARGLVYHAWLGKIVAAAVLNQSESQVPSELLSWRQRMNTQKCQVPAD